MKILHLIYTNAFAGAEKYLIDLLPGLKDYNVESHLICVCPDSATKKLKSYCNEMSEKGIKTSLITGSRHNFLTIAKSINFYLKKENITIIHSHLSNADLIAVLVKLFYNKKICIISSKHGYDEKYLIKYSPDRKPAVIDRNIYYYYIRFLLSKIDYNLSISKAISDLYYNIKLSKKHYHVIEHGILGKKIINPDKNPFQLIIVGRLEKMKGHAYLLNALPPVIKKYPDTKLLIVGDGSEKTNLQNQTCKLGIQDEVIFMGFQPDPYKFISQSLIVILPSLFEPFGLVYIEAFSLQTPVIALDVPSANDIITDNETGILISKFHSEILTEKIIYLLENPKERERLAINAYQKYLSKYTAHRMITETAAWYKSLYSSS